MTLEQRSAARSCVVTLFVAVVLFGAGCQPSVRRSDRDVSQTVHHIVLCWLKEAGDEVGRQKIIEVSKNLAEIPGVRTVKAGTALSSDRAIVDDSFDVAIVFTFAGRRAMDEYLVHPKHKKAVAEVLRPLVTKLLVYDFVE